MQRHDCYWAHGDETQIEITYTWVCRFQTDKYGEVFHVNVTNYEIEVSVQFLNWSFQRDAIHVILVMILGGRHTFWKIHIFYINLVDQKLHICDNNNLYFNWYMNVHQVKSFTIQFKYILWFLFVDKGKDITLPLRLYHRGIVFPHSLQKHNNLPFCVLVFSSRQRIIYLYTENAHNNEQWRPRRANILFL